jgi:hypothetical protein
MNIRRITPLTDKKILILLAGTMWCGVGVMLVRLAILWLSLYSRGEQELFYIIGFIAAMAIHHFGFIKIANKNLNRLLPLTEKKCIFSFMTWRSYFLVLIMVSMGIALRHSSIPKLYLSVLYFGIGLALFLSGIRYFRFFIKLLFEKNL